MTTDLKTDLLDEIALEGLDGITLNALWSRLQERKGFSLFLDDQCKAYLWCNVMALEDLQFYKLPKPRPVLVPYNRFQYVDPDTKHFLDIEDIQQDIYPVNILENELVKGSCADYRTRKDITEEILSEKPSLSVALERYGNSLVIVASPDDRLRALIGSENDPNFALSDICYCLLERIGRSRYSGEVSAGKHSLTQLVDSSKTLFYQMQKLKALAIIRKQRMCTIRKPSNVKVTLCVFHLKRFFQPVVSKTHLDVLALARYLDSKPEDMDMVNKTKQALRIFDKVFKKVVQATDSAGDRFFQFLDIPYREVYPNATPKEYLWKSGHAERTIQHIRLVKPLAEVEAQVEQADSSDEEEEEKKTYDDGLQLEFHRQFDKPYLYQILEIIQAAGSRGISQTELKHVLHTGKLMVRRFCNFLHRQKYVTTVLLNKGKYKEVMYVAVDNVKDNMIRKSVVAEIEKFGDLSVEEFCMAPHRNHGAKTDSGPMGTSSQFKEVQDPQGTDCEAAEKDKFSLSVDPPTEQKICDIKNELNKLDEMNPHILTTPSKARIEIFRERTDEGTLINVRIEEMTMVGPEYPMPGSENFGLKKFGKMITDVHIRRLNWIVEVVAAVKVLELFRLRRLLRAREAALNLSYMMDQKSLKRLVVALVQEKRIRSYSVWISMAEKKREIHYICDVGVNQNDIELTRAIEHAKLRYFSVSKEELKKKNRSLAKLESPPKHILMMGTEIPEMAMASIQKHKKNSLSMKYNRNAGVSYGLLPKMLRIRTAHQLLWHVCHDTYGKEIVEERSDNTEGVDRESITGPARETTAGNTPGDPVNLDEKRKTGNKAKGKTIKRRKRKVEETVGEEKDKMAKKQKLEKDMAKLQDDKAIQGDGQCASVEQETYEAADTEGKLADMESRLGDTEGKLADTEGKLADVEGKLADTEGKLAEGKNEDQMQKKSSEKVLLTEEKVLSGEPLSTTVTTWMAKEPHIYFDEMTWRRYLPPVLLHQGFPKGWCLISDILLNLPVSLFCQIVNVSYDIQGLHEILNDSKKRFYPVMKLPISLSQQLLHSKKYVTSFFELSAYLCEMGLLSFGQEVMKEKEQTFIYVHRNAMLLDTRDSKQGYNKTRPQDGTEFPVKTYHFDSLADVNSYWEDLQVIAIGSNLGYKSVVNEDLADTTVHTVRSLKDAAKTLTPDTVLDDGVIPGDRRGAAGMDTGLYVHTVKNWTFSSMSRSAITDKQYRKLNITDNINIVGKRKVVRPLKDQPRLCLSENADKPVQMKILRGEKARGNKGGKGVKKTRNNICRQEGRRRSRKVLTFSKFKKPGRKKPAEKGDEKDKAIYAKRRKQRVIWTAKEDSVLLMCWLACLLMDKSRRVSIVSYKVMRDYLHDTVGEVSHDKTSIAVARRLKYVLKNSQTEANLLLFYREGNQDQFIRTEFVEKVFFNTDKEVVPKFCALVDHLLEKFASLNLQKSNLPASLGELSQYRMEVMGKLRSAKVFRDVSCKEDICHDVLRNILHSAVLLKDKHSRTHEMFKLLTQYPDALLSNVIKELRSDGLLVLQKKNYAKVALSQLQYGLGIRNFKVSQRYMYNYKHRNLSTLFEESAGFLDALCDQYLENEGTDQSITLDFRPNGGQSAIMMALVLQKKLDISLSLPQELVVVDMEGFYNFPWGRGKSNTSSASKADRTLQEMVKSKVTKDKRMEGRNVVQDLETDKFDLDIEDDEDDDMKLVDSQISKSQDMGVESLKQVSLPGKEDLAAVVNSSETKLESSGNEDSKAAAKSAVNEEECGAKKGPTASGSNNSDKVTLVGKQFALVGKTIEEIKLNLAAEGFRESDDSGNAPLPYICISNGSSTFISPKPVETDHGMMPSGSAGFASRTLLSLRRAEGVSFEDIRVFNAQDNFVVNSCKVVVKLRDSPENDRLQKTEIVEVISNNPDEIRPFVESDEKKKYTLEEKKDFIDNLRLSKKKMTDMWNELIRLLPFQLDIDKVWEVMAKKGLSQEEIDQHRLLYQCINSEGFIGIRAKDLQKYFPNTVHLRNRLKGLLMYAAIVNVGVTCTRYVSLTHARPWLVHAYRNIKGRGLHAEEEGQQTLPEDQNAESEQSSKPRVPAEGMVMENSASSKEEESYVKRQTEEQCLEGPDGHNPETQVDTTATESLAAKISGPDQANTDHMGDLGISLAKKPRLDDEAVFETKDQMLTDSGKESSLLEEEMLSHNQDVVPEGNSIKLSNEAMDPQLEQNCAESDNLEDGAKTARTLRKRKHDDDDLNPVRSSSPPLKSTYDCVRLVIQPWRKPEGGINTPIFKMMLESVMLFFMLKPGSSEASLVKRYSPYLQPMVLRNIVEILMDLGCLTQHNMRKPKVSLFSTFNPDDMILDNHSACADDEDVTTYYLPTEECIFRLGQFGKAMFPNAKWPDTTVQ